MALHTPKRPRPLAEMLPSSPPMNSLFPWNWSEEARNAVTSSPGSSCSSPEYTSGRGGPGARSRGSESHRRGRPRADILTNLMLQGSTSPSSIKCTFCNRVFPREKSLQAHLRTHTGRTQNVLIQCSPFALENKGYFWIVFGCFLFLKSVSLLKKC